MSAGPPSSARDRSRRLCGGGGLPWAGLSWGASRTLTWALIPRPSPTPTPSPAGSRRSWNAHPSPRAAGEAGPSRPPGTSHPRACRSPGSPGPTGGVEPREGRRDLGLERRAVSSLASCRVLARRPRRVSFLPGTGQPRSPAVPWPRADALSPFPREYRRSSEFPSAASSKTTT